MTHHRNTRHIAAISLVLLIALSSVLGAVNGVVICFYPKGDKRPPVELLSHDVSEAGVECVVPEMPIFGSKYPSCTDLLLKSADWLLVRPVTLKSGDVLFTKVTRGKHITPVTSFLPEIPGSWGLIRRLNHVESTAELVSRVIVLRL